MRSGSTSSTGGICGNPRCLCHQPNDPGHGPFLRLTREVKGRTVTESFATPSALRKAQREVEELHRFRQLRPDLLEVNEQICRLRPVEETLTPQGSNGRSDPERSRSGRRPPAAGRLWSVRKSERFDLETVETLVRGSMHRASATILGRLLSEPTAQAIPALCGCGHRARYHDTRARRLLTMLGPVEFHRGYIVCPHCFQGQSPRDRELSMEGTEFSPGVRRMMAAVDAESSFEQGREQLELLARLEVTAKAV